MSDSAQVIATVPKNSRETVHIALTTFKGNNLVDIRIFAGGAEVGAEARIPTPKGVSLNLTALAALIRGLVRAEAEALSRGLITPEQTDGLMSALPNSGRGDDFRARLGGNRGTLRRTSRTHYDEPGKVASDADDLDAPRLPFTGTAE